MHQPLATAPTIYALCVAVDRSDAAALEQFDLACLRDLSSAIGSQLGIEFTSNHILPRNQSSAKKQTSIDFRSMVLWNFVSSWSTQASGGIKAVAAALDLNKDALGRYYRNSSKNRTLSESVVSSTECVIIRYLLADPPNNDTQAHPTAPTNHSSTAQPKNETRVVPLHFHSVEGGGFTSIQAVGETVNQSDWLLCPQRSDIHIPLRRGMKGRKLFTKGALQGRVFEWCIVEDRHPFRAGKPKFVLRELTQDEAIGVLMRSQERWSGCGPEEMWTEMLRAKLGEGKRCGAGLRWCGFDTEGVRQLIEAAEGCDEHHETQRQFGVHTPISEYGSCSMQKLVAHASQEFRAAMLAVCPMDPQAAFRALMQSQKFQRDWQHEHCDPVLNTPLCRGLVDAHNNADTKERKRSILSL